MLRINQVRHYAELCGVKSILQTSPLKIGKGHLDLNNLKYDKTAADRFSLTSRYAQNPDFIANLKLTAENRHLATEALSNKKLQKMLDRYADDRDKINQVNKFITQINDKNIKYLDDVIDIAKKKHIDMDYYPYLLHGWNKDTYKILDDFYDKKQIHLFDRLLDTIKRRGHSYDSVKKVLNTEHPVLDANALRLLEFKNFDKYKTVTLDNFSKLPIKDKKDFINCFVSSINPLALATEAKYYPQRLASDMKYLKEQMNIFKEIDISSAEKISDSYYTTLKRMLDDLPEAEKYAPKKRTLNLGEFNENMYKKFQKPPLVEDVSALPTKPITVNGQNIRTGTINYADGNNYAVHYMPNGKTILNIEALETTDPNYVLACCLSTGRAHGTNQYSLLLQPRQKGDWFLQSHVDIDSGTGALKNLDHVTNIDMKHGIKGSLGYVPNLIKKKMNISHDEYLNRLANLKDANSLQEVKTLDNELYEAIKAVTRENKMYEGIIRPDVRGIVLPKGTALENAEPAVIDYAARKNIPVFTHADIS